MAPLNAVFSLGISTQLLKHLAEHGLVIRFLWIDFDRLAESSFSFSRPGQIEGQEVSKKRPSPGEIGIEFDRLPVGRFSKGPSLLFSSASASEPPASVGRLITQLLSQIPWHLAEKRDDLDLGHVLFRLCQIQPVGKRGQGLGVPAFPECRVEELPAGLGRFSTGQGTVEQVVSITQAFRSALGGLACQLGQSFGLGIREDQPHQGHEPIEAVSGGAAVAHEVVDVGEAVGEEVGLAFWVAGGFGDEAGFAQGAELGADLVAGHAGDAGDGGDFDGVPGQGDGIEDALLLDGQGVHDGFEIGGELVEEAFEVGADVAAQAFGEETVERFDEAGIAAGEQVEALDGAGAFLQGFGNGFVAAGFGEREQGQFSSPRA